MANYTLDMTEKPRRSESATRDGLEDSSSIDFENREELNASLDEEKTDEIGLDGFGKEALDGDEISSHSHDSDRPGLPHARSLRSIKSHQSRAGADGYTCLDEERPNISRGGTVADEPFLVKWDGDADPMNPRSMTKLRRWAIVLIVSASSLCVYVLSHGI